MRESKRFGEKEMMIHIANRSLDCPASTVIVTTEDIKRIWPVLSTELNNFRSALQNDFFNQNRERFFQLEYPVNCSNTMKLYEKVCKVKKNI
ncbi:hypothetical protein H5410_059772 [Solanum commersonii]|uniref:Uncharacterized protein n=1 Tax=Solanum commersonii TaxID=4109 RepID=A0A9J5W4H3_SOLCO|nr:hypothetical protein H5410_059772 [Solanum commersonii]